MKKLLIFMCLVGLVGLPGMLFAGGASEKVVEGPVTITYISSTILESPEGVFEQKIIDEFNALNNGIRVEVHGVPSNGLTQKYIALATAGDLPDFFLVHDNDASRIADLGVAADLRTVFEPEYIDAINNTYLNLFSYKGTLYGLPWFTAPPGVLYRKDIFDANNITIPKTWDEFVTVAEKLTKDGQYGITLVGTKNSSGAARFQHVIRNFGVDEFYQDSKGKWQTDIGSDKYIKALRAFTDLDLKSGAVPPGVVETGYPEAVGLFSSGKAAMLITGSNAIGAITSQVPELKGQLGSFTIPAVERLVSAPNGSAFFINKDGNVKESATFLKYLLKEENTLAFAELTGRVTTRAMKPDNPALTKPELEGFLLATKGDYSLPAISGYGEVMDIHGEAFQNVFTKIMTVEEAAKNAGQRAQRMCDKANNL